jgi:hypothetical protein
MRPFRSPFAKVIVALLFGVSAVPSWACARDCRGSSSESLACVKLCAHSRALLTQDGKLASVGEMACSVAGVDAAPALSSAGFELRAPSPAATLAPVTVESLPAIPALAPAQTRGPPLPHAYLSSQHPFANGPPTLL